MAVTAVQVCTARIFNNSYAPHDDSSAHFSYADEPAAVAAQSPEGATISLPASAASPSEATQAEAKAEAGSSPHATDVAADPEQGVSDAAQSAQSGEVQRDGSAPTDQGAAQPAASEVVEQPAADSGPEVQPAGSDGTEQTYSQRRRLLRSCAPRCCTMQMC